MRNGLFSGYLLLSDIDMTLTDDKGRISDENAAAIRYFQKEGGLFTVASGRYPTYIERYADRFVPNTYIIGINGTELYDPEKKETVLTRTLDDHDDVRAVMHAMIDGCEELAHIVMSAYRQEQTILGKDFTQLDAFLETVSGPWHRLIFVQPAAYTERNMRYLGELCGGRYALDRSWSEGIELHRTDSGKGELLPEMKRLLAAKGSPVHTVVCTGDYENDLSMFRNADISYAVENAIPELLEAADRVTVHHNRSAIAHIIADLEERIRAQL